MVRFSRLRLFRVYIMFTAAVSIIALAFVRRGRYPR
jgi:hypothetical protein